MADVKETRVRWKTRGSMVILLGAEDLADVAVEYEKDTVGLG